MFQHAAVGILPGLDDPLAEHEEEEEVSDDDDDENVSDDEDEDEDEEDPANEAERRQSGSGRGGLHHILGRVLVAFLLNFDFSPSSRKQGGNRGDKKHWPREDEEETLYLSGPKVYSCSNCRTHLSTDDDVISRAFQGRGGRAFLFEQVVNVSTGPVEDRILMTGLHKVADIFCKHCHENLGWKYEEAFEESQKYKEGRFILEKVRITRGDEGGGGGR